MIMFNYATVIDILQRENDTLIQVRYCHLLGIWFVFIVDMLFSFFFFNSAYKIYVDIYLKIFGCILVLYTHQI